jgi:hypothetical protein
MNGEEPACRLRSHWWVCLVYLSLLAAGIPWYWPQDDITVWLGMPAWVVVAIAASLAASLFTAWLLSHPWPAEGGARDETDC